MAKKIQLKGTLINNDLQEIYDYFGKEATSVNKLVEQFPEDEADIIIEANSNGGFVTAGSEIYTALRNYKGKVTVEV
ncbi:ATP-dependent Clp protease proteolytic subunit, partial [Streptococcus agalactiae]